MRWICNTCESRDNNWYKNSNSVINVLIGGLLRVLVSTHVSYRNRNSIGVSNAVGAISCASVLSDCMPASWRWTLLAENNSRREATPEWEWKDILSWEVNTKYGSLHSPNCASLLCFSPHFFTVYFAVVFDVLFFSASREFLSWVPNEIAERSLRSLSPVTRKFMFSFLS